MSSKPLVLSIDSCLSTPALNICGLGHRNTALPTHHLLLLNAKASSVTLQAGIFVGLPNYI